MEGEDGSMGPPPPGFTVSNPASKTRRRSPARARPGGATSVVGSRMAADPTVHRREFTPGTDSGLRGKVPPQRGFSQLDWARKVAGGEDLSGASVKGGVTMSEVRTHNTRDDCWLVLRGAVYNVTPYLRFHPGGVDELMRGAGDDATALFDETHKWVNYQHLLQNCLVGPLVRDAKALSATAAASSSAAAAPGSMAPPPPRGGGAGGGDVDAGSAAAAPRAALHSEEWRAFRFAARKQLTPDTYIFRFLLPEGCVFGLPRAGLHVVFRATIGGKVVERPYTPVSLLHQRDHVDFVIKVYDRGVMSKHVDSLRAGDSLEMRGPRGAFSYEHGLTHVGKRSAPVKQLAMVAAGSGITPMMQVLRTALLDNDSPVELTLLFANRTRADIIMRAELDKLAAAKPTAFRVTYFVSDGGGAGDGEGKEDDGVIVGRIDQAALAKHLPPPSTDICVLVCGPSSFNDDVDLALRRLYYPADMGIVVL